MFIQNNRRRKTRNILIGTIGFMMLLLTACIAGYTYSRDQMSKQAEQEQASSGIADTDYPTLNIPISTPTPAPTPSDDELYNPAMAEPSQSDTLLEGVRMDMKYEYYLCEHTHSATITENLVGKTSEQIELEFRCEVQDFTPSYVVAKKSYNMYCPDHYILRSKDGDLQVLKTVLGQDEMVIDREIEGIAMPPDEELEKGIVFDSLEAIELYLENIES